MNRILVVTSAILVSSFIHRASAAVIQRDWKTPGDGQLTFDDVNQREWLDVPISNLDNFAIPKLENALLELEPGRIFEEFTLAKPEDVDALAESAGISTSTIDFARNEAATGRLIDLLGITWGVREGRFGTLGLLDGFETIADRRFRLAAILEVEPFQPKYAGLSISGSDDRIGRGGSTGLMLFRNAIPEPTSNHLAIIILLFLWRMRPRTLP